MAPRAWGAVLCRDVDGLVHTCVARACSRHDQPPWPPQPLHYTSFTVGVRNLMVPATTVINNGSTAVINNGWWLIKADVVKRSALTRVMYGGRQWLTTTDLSESERKCWRARERARKMEREITETLRDTDRNTDRKTDRQTGRTREECDTARRVPRNIGKGSRGVFFVCLVSRHVLLRFADSPRSGRCRLRSTSAARLADTALPHRYG